MKKGESSGADKTDRSAVASIIVRLLLSLSVAVLLIVFVAVVFCTDYDGSSQLLVNLINGLQ